MQVRPQSHVDTPEWQSFEARMLARRAARRAEAARIRRARLARGAAAAALFVAAGALGFAGTWIIRQPIAFTVAPPIAPPEVALRINDAAVALPANDAEPVALVETPSPADVTIVAEDDAYVPPPAASEDAALTSAERRPTPIKSPVESSAFRERVPERVAPAPRATSQPTTPEPPTAPPVTVVPETRDTAPLQGPGVPDSRVAHPTATVSAANGPAPVGTAGTTPAVPALTLETTAPVSTGTVRATPDAAAAIRDVLERYRTAYERLDAAAAGAVWPGVDRRALARAFDSLQSQQIDFRDCRILTAAAIAHATCRGRARAVPKIGSGGATEAERTWEFSLIQKGNDWQIARATVR